MMTSFLYVTFPVSEVSTWVFIPPLVAFVVSFFTSMGGVSGAFILLPFQVSILNYTTPSVSGTNQLFNIIAIPSGVRRYVKEKRMVWTLTWAVIIGTLPGVLIGAWIRLEYLPNSKDFKLFAGCVLFYIGIKLLLDILKKKVTPQSKQKQQNTDFAISNSYFSVKRAGFEFDGQAFSFSVPGVFSLCFIVGIIGGIYGIGGGSIIAPFLITFFRLPVHAIAGAALMGTFVTSIFGVISYQTLASSYLGIIVAPDYYLGLLLGIGGALGMYFGAKFQKYVPDKVIKLILCSSVFFITFKYLYDFIT